MSSNELINEREIFEYLGECLHQGEVRVVFEKANGEERTMLCTLLESYYPDYVFSMTGDIEAPSSVMRVWDIEADDWRSIRRGSIKEVELVKAVPVTEDIG